jgi:hypothetical protein
LQRPGRRAHTAPSGLVAHRDESSTTSNWPVTTALLSGRSLVHLRSGASFIASVADGNPGVLGTGDGTRARTLAASALDTATRLGLTYVRSRAEQLVDGRTD